jgi:hypothetical protein
MGSPNNSLSPPPINTPITTSGPDPVGTPFQNRRASGESGLQGGLASGNVTMGWIQWFNSIWTFIAALFPFLSGTGMLGVIANAPIVTSGLGTSGEVLTSNGAAVAPSFQAAGSALSTFAAQRISNPWFGTPATARALSTVYQNLVTPARPILVSVQVFLATSTISDLEVGPTNPPTAIPSSFSNNSAVSSLGVTHTAVVPPNYFYQVLGGSLVSWIETA